MTVQINGKREILDTGALTVNELLSVKSVPDPQMVSVQLNGETVELEDFASRSVIDGDEVEFLYFMGGGSHGAGK